MKISIIGCGYVGTVTGVCFADLGHDIIFYDIDRKKLDPLARGEAPVTVFGDGEQTRDFTYIDDIVRVNRQLLEASATDGYAMNVGGDHRITVNELIEHLREITGSTLEVVYPDKQKGGAEHTLADTSLAGELVRYRVETTIQNGLKKFVVWYTGSSRHQLQ